MKPTRHMTERMAQRNFTPAMIDAILDMGDWNERGDRVIVDRRQYTELDQTITALRRYLKVKVRELNDLERLRKKGQAIVVAKDDSLITVFKKTRKG